MLGLFRRDLGVELDAADDGPDHGGASLLDPLDDFSEGRRAAFLTPAPAKRTIPPVLITPPEADPAPSGGLRMRTCRESVN